MTLSYFLQENISSKRGQKFFMSPQVRTEIESFSPKQKERVHPCVPNSSLFSSKSTHRHIWEKNTRKKSVKQIPNAKKRIWFGPSHRPKMSKSILGQIIQKIKILSQTERFILNTHTQINIWSKTEFISEIVYYIVYVRFVSSPYISPFSVHTMYTRDSIFILFEFPQHYLYCTISW